MEIKNIDFFFETHPSPMWIYDPCDCTIHGVNRAACDLYGYSEEEFCSMTLADICAENHDTEVAGPPNPIETLQDAEIRQRRKDGSVIMVQVNSHPLSYEGRDLQLVTVQDLTREVEYKQELEMLVDKSLDGIMLTSPDGRIHQANPAACRILGMEEEEIIRLGREGLVYKDSLMEEAIERRNRTGNFSGELTFIHKSGRKVPVEVTTSIYTNVQGEQRSSLVFRDITRRNATERKLHDIVEHSTNMFYRHDPDHVLTYASQQSNEFLGCPPEEAKRKWTEFATDHPVNQAGIQLTEKAIKTGKAQPGFPLQLRKATGEIIWVQVNEAPIVEQGKTVAMVGALTDITELKQYEEQLQNILDRITDAFFAVDRDWTVTYWNKQAEVEVGVPHSEIVGMNLWEKFPEAKELKFFQEYERSLNEQVPVNFEEYYPPIERWLEVNAYPSKEGLSVFFRDVTRQKDEKSKLVKALAEKDTLLMEIHHRVKNNLAVVSGMMQLQAYEEKDETLKQKLGDSIGRIKTMASIHELLYRSESFSKLDADRNIRKLVTEIVDTYQTAVDLDISFDLQRVSLNINQAIPFSLIINEVITNVLKHAFDCTGNGDLAVTLKEKDDVITVQVEDNGKGLPKNFTNFESKNTLGMQLIDTLSNQLHADYHYRTVDGKTRFEMSFERTDVKGIGNHLLK